MFMVYFTGAGIGYLVSIVISQSNAQLVGVLVILVSMMFSGSNPTLEQMDAMGTIGSVLKLPTYVSFIRFMKSFVGLTNADGLRSSTTLPKSNRTKSSTVTEFSTG
jgi:uncharacterized membrane protein